ncbi:MAG: AarF/UbiB family protein, partial [Clostridia bacterium]
DGIDIDNREALLSAGYNTKEIATKLVYNYIKQILTDGFFHADPHQGNLKIRDGKIVWFDFGMIGRISERDRKLLSNAMKAAVDNDIPAIKNVMKTMGNCNAPIDDITLTSDIEMIFNKYASASLAELDIAQILTEMLSIAKKHRISLPSGITMLGRGIATIEGLIASLDPETSFTDVISGYVKSEAIDNFDIKAELQETLTNLYRSGKNSANLPQSIFSALKTYQSGQTKMSIETHNSPTENKNSDKRNKLLSGSILSGLLFTGASIVMLNQSLPTYWGLPVMSWIGYLSSLAILVGAYIDNRRKK